MEEQLSQRMLCGMKGMTVFCVCRWVCSLWWLVGGWSPYNSASKRCNLCLKEKLLIIHQPELSSLNKRNEHVSSCHHRNKQLLCILTIEQSIEISRHAFMQVCKLYKWWLWIFFTIKSPDEWVITKQACRDESIVSLFFPLSQCIYIYHYMLYCSIHFISPLLPLYPIFLFSSN